MDIKDRVRESLGERILEWREHSKRRIYVTVDRKDIFQTARILFRELGLRFSIASGMDTPKAFEILYHFSFDESGEIFSIRVLIEDKKNPEIDAITPIFPAAEWIEREIWEMFGIKFKGHPNLKRLLLDEDWPEGNYPLRKNN